jgi:homoisocitrate dehydrogenase
LFEPVHGAAPDIAGRGIANPLAAFGCVAMLLEWASRQGLIQRRRTDVRRSSILRMAMATVQRQGMRTPDLGGNATTEEVTAAVLEQVHAWLADE